MSVSRRLLWILALICHTDASCSPTSYYKSCWIRRHAGLSVDVDESQRRGAEVLRVFQEETAQKCSRTCCLTPNFSCSLAVFHYNVSGDAVNCFHLHCPSARSCALHHAANVILYNVTKGVDPDLLVFGKHFTTNVRVLPHMSSSRLNVSEPLTSDKRHFNHQPLSPAHTISSSLETISKQSGKTQESATLSPASSPKPGTDLRSETSRWTTAYLQNTSAGSSTAWTLLNHSSGKPRVPSSTTAAYRSAELHWTSTNRQTTREVTTSISPTNPPTTAELISSGSQGPPTDVPSTTRDSAADLLTMIDLNSSSISSIQTDNLATVPSRTSSDPVSSGSQKSPSAPQTDAFSETPTDVKISSTFMSSSNPTTAVPSDSRSQWSSSEDTSSSHNMTLIHDSVNHSSPNISPVRTSTANPTTITSSNSLITRSSGSSENLESQTSQNVHTSLNVLSDQTTKTVSPRRTTATGPSFTQWTLTNLESTAHNLPTDGFDTTPVHTSTYPPSTFSLTSNNQQELSQTFETFDETQSIINHSSPSSSLVSTKTPTSTMFHQAPSSTSKVPLGLESTAQRSSLGSIRYSTSIASQTTTSGSPLKETSRHHPTTQTAIPLSEGQTSSSSKTHAEFTIQQTSTSSDILQLATTSEPSIFSNSDSPTTSEPSIFSNSDSPTTSEPSIFSNSDSPTTSEPSIFSNSDSPTTSEPAIFSNSNSPTTSEPAIFSDSESPTTSRPSSSLISPTSGTVGSRPYPNDTKGFIGRNVSTADAPPPGSFTTVWHLATNTVLVVLAACATVTFGCCCSVFAALSWRGRRRRKGRYRTSLRGKGGSMRLIKYVIVRESS